MAAGELQRLAEEEGKAESMHQAKAEGDHPAPLGPRPSRPAPLGRALPGPRADDVLEGHVHNRQRDQRFDQRRKPQRPRRHAHGRGDQGDRMGDGERGHHGNQMAQAAQWNHQAEQEQEMVHAFEDVFKAHDDEAQRRLVPARVEFNEPRIAEIVESPLAAIGQDEAQHRGGLVRQRAELRVNREIGIRRLDRIAHQHIEHALAPEQVDFVAERRRVDVLQRGVEIGEGPARRQRHPHRPQVLLCEFDSVLVEPQRFGNVDPGRVAQGEVGFADSQVARAAQGKADLAEGFHRNPQQRCQLVAFRLDEGVDGDPARDFVGGRGRGQREEAGEHCGRRQTSSPTSASHRLHPPRHRRRLPAGAPV